MWLEFETDKRDILSVRIDRKRKQPAHAARPRPRRDRAKSTFWAPTTWCCTLDRLGNHQKSPLSSCTSASVPSEPPTIDSAHAGEGLFFNPQRYDLAKVGRYKIDKLGFDADNDASTLTDEDITATMKYIIAACQ